MAANGFQTRTGQIWSGRRAAPTVTSELRPVIVGLSKRIHSQEETAS